METSDSGQLRQRTGAGIECKRNYASGTYPGSYTCITLNIIEIQLEISRIYLQSVVDIVVCLFLFWNRYYVLYKIIKTDPVNIFA